MNTWLYFQIFFYIHYIPTYTSSPMRLTSAVAHQDILGLEAIKVQNPGELNAGGVIMWAIT